MRVWFKNLSSLLGEEDLEESSVQRILESAASRAAVVGLSSDPTTVRPDPDCGVIDAIDGDHIVISRHDGDGAWPQGTMPGDSVYIAVAASRGFYTGQTQIVSRWSGRDIGLDRCGYRVRVPQTMIHSQRRSSERMPVAFDLAPRATVRTADLEKEIGGGVVLDLSGTGLRMRTVSSREMLVGELVSIHAHFAHTIPAFEALAEIVHVFPSRVPDSRILGLRFVDKRPDIARAIEALDLKRAARAA